MPCRSDYMEPTNKENRLQETAKLLCYVYTQLGLESTIPVGWLEAADNCYCEHDLVPDLCAVLKGLAEKTLDRIVYSPKNKMARKLADWWEEHLEADRKREAEEARAIEVKVLISSAKSKLSAAEKMALGLKDDEDLRESALAKLTADEKKALGLK